VLQILDPLATARVVVRVDVGWSVDAPIGRQTREHEDLDLVVSWLAQTVESTRARLGPDEVAAARAEARLQSLDELIIQPARVAV